MKVITRNEFDALTFTKLSTNGKTHIFKCDQDSLMNIQLFEGDDYEHFSVHFLNDISVLADSDDDPNDLDDDGYLNIDARPEIIFDYLESMI